MRRGRGRKCKKCKRRSVSYRRMRKFLRAIGFRM